MAPRKSNISQVNATGEDSTPIKEREGVNIEVDHECPSPRSSSLTSDVSVSLIALNGSIVKPSSHVTPLFLGSRSPLHRTPRLTVRHGNQDLSLPRTMVQRLAKGVLPANTSLHKDAILAMSKGATVFINYLAHAANTASLSDGKRTIPPHAVIEALAELEFESFGPRVEAELKKFNEVQTGKRNEYRRKVKQGKMSGVKGDDGGEEEEEEGRAKKRVRREEGDEVLDERDDGRERRESGTGDPSAQLQTGYREYEAEDPDDDDDFDADGQGGEEGENDASIRPRDAQDAEEEEEGEEEEEEEEDEEEDDEDEYPDEGRRLSSVEREANGSFGRPGETPGTSADEGASEDEDSD